MTATVLRGDARQLPFPDGSVDLIVTSPPYWGQRDYRDGDTSLAGQIGAEPTPQEYMANLLACTAEWVRVLKPSGSVFVNLGDKYAQRDGQGSNGHRGGSIAASGSGYHLAGQADMGGRPWDNGGVQPKSLIGLPWRYALGCVDDLGLILRAEIIWSKPNGLPESVTDRVRRSHESLFHLVKQPRYYSAVDAIREPHTSDRHPGVLTWAERKANGDSQAWYSDQNRHGGSLGMAGNPLGKLPGSDWGVVWDVPSQPLIVPPELGVHHYAAFPFELPRRCILGWCPPGGTVVDPFGGSGTVALVADVLGRAGFSFDLSASYGQLARWRTTDRGERARAMQVPKPPPVAAGQDALFEELS
jgi:site-specific DNA-methyltransferase (cytosine-N4-specific)